jgi:hypothetical protein
LPPAGSGLFGLVEAFDFLKDEPFPEAIEDLAAMNFLLFDLRATLALLLDFFVIFNFELIIVFLIILI